jgi:hypothetical protein
MAGEQKRRIPTGGCGFGALNEKLFEILLDVETEFYQAFKQLIGWSAQKVLQRGAESRDHPSIPQTFRRGTILRSGV